MSSFLTTGDPDDFLAFIEEQFPNTSFNRKPEKIKGESQTEYERRWNADKQTYITMMASNTMVSASGARAIQIARAVREGYHIANTSMKLGVEKVGMRDIFLQWLDLIGIKYTAEPAEISRMVRFYLDTLPRLESLTGRKMSDMAIANLHSNYEDFALRHIQRVASELVTSFSNMNLLTSEVANRILDELEQPSPNAASLERELRVKIQEAVETPETISATVAAIEQPKGYSRELAGGQIRVIFDVDKSLLPVVKKQLGKVGIDIESLTIIEE